MFYGYVIATWTTPGAKGGNIWSFYIKRDGGGQSILLLSFKLQKRRVIWLTAFKRNESTDIKMR